MFTIHAYNWYGGVYEWLVGLHQRFTCHCGYSYVEHSTALFADLKSNRLVTWHGMASYTITDQDIECNIDMIKVPRDIPMFAVLEALREAEQQALRDPTVVEKRNKFMSKIGMLQDFERAWDTWRFMRRGLSTDDLAEYIRGPGQKNIFAGKDHHERCEMQRIIFNRIFQCSNEYAAQLCEAVERRISTILGACCTSKSDRPVHLQWYPISHPTMGSLGMVLEE